MVQRSNGCLLCVKRRVKCDERHPRCLRCENYGQPCPGYDREFKFVAAKPYRSRRQPKPSFEDDNSCAISSNGSAEKGKESADVDSVGHDLQTEAQAPPLQLPRRAMHDLPNGLSKLQPSGHGLNITQSLQTLTDELSQPFPSNSGYVISRWLLLIPGIYGSNTTLDCAIKAFSAHHIGNLTLNKQAMRYARSAYLEALARLRTSLDSSAEALSSEIYCSVLLLCLYELFADTHRGDVWMSHAKGLSQLTEARGPSRFRTEFDAVLLKASRGLIVMHSLFGNEACLLASDDWHRVMKEQSSPGLSAGFNESVEEFFTYFTFSPDLVHKLYSLEEANLGDTRTFAKVSRLLDEALSFLEKLVLWYDKFSQTTLIPHDVLSPTKDALFPTILWYSDINSATIYCGYYSFMVLIHEILKTYGYPGEHGAMVAYYRDQICKSVEYTAQGLLGPYRVGFPLRVACEVADPVTREWISGRLKKFSEFYAVLREDFAKPNFVGQS